mmetsp:Transcript_21006/g.46638  ORF Transcript_21006/g.46638 Transcript_21006/m.46638 type:complete len:112 (+) Transcript_21006:41-376(+)
MIRAFEAVMSLTDDTERKNKLQKLESDYRNRNWITARLMVELQLLFPTAEDIDSINNNKSKLTTVGAKQLTLDFVVWEVIWRICSNLVDTKKTVRKKVPHLLSGGQVHVSV